MNPDNPSDIALAYLELKPEDVEGQIFYFGAGCDYCNHTGYRGRMGIYEIMLFGDEIRNLIMKHASTNILREAAQRNGMRSLREAGLLAIYDGITTIEEVVRETLIGD